MLLLLKGAAEAVAIQNLHCQPPHYGQDHAKLVRHQSKQPAQLVEECSPPQFWMPAVIRDAPIKKMVTPVTTGGKTRLSILGGMKERATDHQQQTSSVPRILP